MKRVILILSLVLVINSVKAQDTSKIDVQNPVNYSKLDSLIVSKTKLYLDNAGVTTSVKTRGVNQDPCYSDMQNLKSAFANLKQAYINCCRNESGNAPVLRALAYIYLITSNPNCSWGWKEYSALAYYWLDYNQLREKYNCLPCSK